MGLIFIVALFQILDAAWVYWDATSIGVERTKHESGLLKRSLFMLFVLNGALIVGIMLYALIASSIKG